MPELPRPSYGDLERLARRIFETVDEGTARILGIANPHELPWEALSPDAQWVYLDAAKFAVEIVVDDMRKEARAAMPELPRRRIRHVRLPLGLRAQFGAPILHPAQPRLQLFLGGINVRAFGRVHWIGRRR